MHAKVRTMEKLSSHNTAGLLYLRVTTGYTTATTKICLATHRLATPRGGVTVRQYSMVYLS